MNIDKSQFEIEATLRSLEDESTPGKARGWWLVMALALGASSWVVLICLAIKLWTVL